MGILTVLKKKVACSPDYILSIFRKWKRDILIEEMKKRAVIGANFNSLEYRRHAGMALRIYNLNSREGVRIGDNVCIDGELFCNKMGRIEIGDFTVINQNTFLNADNLVRIGRYCLIARDVLIQDNNSHPLDPEKRKQQALSHHANPTDTYESDNGPIELEDCVWVGTRSIILKNVKIGYGSIIAAGSVVTKSIPPMSIAAGNPAKVVKTIGQYLSEDIFEIRKNCNAPNNYVEEFKF